MYVKMIRTAMVTGEADCFLPSLSLSVWDWIPPVQAPGDSIWVSEEKALQTQKPNMGTNHHLASSWRAQGNTSSRFRCTEPIEETKAWVQGNRRGGSAPEDGTEMKTAEGKGRPSSAMLHTWGSLRNWATFKKEPDVVAHTYRHSTQEAEEVPGQSKLQSRRLVLSLYYSMLRF